MLHKIPIEGETITFDFLIVNFDESRHNGKNGVNGVRVNKIQARSLATSKEPAILLHRNASDPRDETVNIHSADMSRISKPFDCSVEY